MDKVNLPGLPAKRAVDYADDKGNFARVIFAPIESPLGSKCLTAQAFQITEKGIFVAAPDGYPSRTPSSTHTINISSIGDTHTITPGWVRVLGTYNVDTLPEAASVVSVLPSNGDVGDQVYLDPTLYRWDEGALETIIKSKAQELFNLLIQSSQLLELDF